jgi:CheY-like chemotaxis protein
VIGADALEAISRGGESADIVKLIKESAQRAATIVRQVLLFVRGCDAEDTPAAQESGAETSSAMESPQAAGELVIVADDEPVIAELCRCVLESHGYRVEVAVDGVAALALFDQYRSSVRAVISDMAMPFMDGVDLTRAIRRLDPKVPILIATGSADVAARGALEGFPFVSVLSKPYTQHGLLDALQRCLDSAAK